MKGRLLNPLCVIYFEIIHVMCRKVNDNTKLKSADIIAEKLQFF